LCCVSREHCKSCTTCTRWYQKFHQGNFSLEDESRAGRLQKFETNELQALLDINSAQTEKELAEQLDITQQAISIHLRMMGKVQKKGRWVPHELSKDNKNRRHDTALTLLSKFQETDFLHNYF